MSGHNKWSKIHRQKELTDQRRGREFSRFAQMITLAVKSGHSGDPEVNAQLRGLLDKAREINMPKDNIARAIDRGEGKGEGGAALEEVTYEGYGPGGVAFMVKTTTTNRNRSLSEVKGAFDRFGGSLGSPGSAAYAFSLEGGEYKPMMKIPVTADVQGKVEQLVEDLESQEDVEQVAHNADFGTVFV